MEGLQLVLSCSHLDNTLTIAALTYTCGLSQLKHLFLSSKRPHRMDVRERAAIVLSRACLCALQAGGQARQLSARGLPAAEAVGGVRAQVALAAADQVLPRGLAVPAGVTPDMSNPLNFSVLHNST